MAVNWNPVETDWDNGRWREQAACRHVDAELFFPAGTTGAAGAHVGAAKAVCRSCPVRTHCLEFALESNQESGIWGGMDEEERRRMRKLWRAGRLPSRGAN